MAFACTLCFAQATAHDFVYWTTPPFDAAYATAYAVPKIDIIEPMLMYLPAPLSRMCSNVSDDTLCIEVRFVSMTNRQSSSARFCGSSERRFVPALLTMMSHPLNLSIVASSADCMDVRSVTSHSSGSIRESSPPAAWVSSLSAWVSLSRLRAAIATDAPCCKNPCAMPSPMPPLPPVMKAVLCVRSKSDSFISNFQSGFQS